MITCLDSYTNSPAWTQCLETLQPYLKMRQALYTLSHQAGILFDEDESSPEWMRLSLRIMAPFDEALNDVINALIGNQGLSDAQEEALRALVTGMLS